MEELEATLQRERESLKEEIRKNAQMMGENHNLREEMERSAFTNNVAGTPQNKQKHDADASALLGS